MLQRKVKLQDGTSYDYSVVFQQLFNTLVMYADRYIGSKEESMSIVQDVFLALWEHDNKFENEQALHKYMYASTRNRALNVLRKKGAVQNYRKELANETPEYRDRLLFIEEETMRHLMLEIDKLPEHQREVVLMALENKNNNEIAELLNISVNTVKFHKKNAYKVLRDKMADDYFLTFLF